MEFCLYSGAAMMVPLILSLAMIALGTCLYASGHRKRKSLDVPLLSNHGKFFLGGSLAFLGLGLLALTLVRA